MKEHYVGENRSRTQNRIQGLLALAMAGIFLPIGIREKFTPLILGGGAFLIDGATDLITGYHHYLGVRAYEGICSLIKRIRNR